MKIFETAKFASSEQYNLVHCWITNAPLEINNSANKLESDLIAIMLSDRNDEISDGTKAG